MREDRLSPVMGRLIDSVKMLLAEIPAGEAQAEAIALLTEDGSIFAGVAVIDPSEGCCDAAEVALAAWEKAGAAGIDAAAVAVSPEEDSVVPCPECAAALAAVDPDLPMVVRRLGRWVFVPLSSLEDPR